MCDVVWAAPRQMSPGRCGTQDAGTAAGQREKCQPPRYRFLMASTGAHTRLLPDSVAVRRRRWCRMTSAVERTAALTVSHVTCRGHHGPETSPAAEWSRRMRAASPGMGAAQRIGIGGESSVLRSTTAGQSVGMTESWSTPGLATDRQGGGKASTRRGCSVTDETRDSLPNAVSW